MEKEGLYFFEKYTESIVKGIKVDELYYQGKTEHQFVQIFKNAFLGKVLFLDEKIQSAQIDEYIYHESLVHPAFFTHPSPRHSLIIGGGEGATLREVLRHACVRKAVMVDIDKELVELCQKHLPEWSEGAFSDPRAQLIFRNARRFLEGLENKYDVIVSDLTEPLASGPSVYLFTKEFFTEIFHSLEEDGVFVLQAGSADPFYFQFFASCAKTLEQIFPVVKPYWTFIFSFGLPWGFIIASKKHDPLNLSRDAVEKAAKTRKVKGLRYYHPGLHESIFSLPLYLHEGFKQGKVLTSENPFIWKL